MATKKYTRHKPSIYYLPVRDKSRTKWLTILPGQTVELDESIGEPCVERGRLKHAESAAVATEARELKPGQVDYDQPATPAPAPQQQTRSQQVHQGRGGR